MKRRFNEMNLFSTSAIKNRIICRFALCITAYISVALGLVQPAARGATPSLTLHGLFNAVDLRSVQISPDGRSVAVETVRPDWTANRFRSDLWLYRDANGGQPGRLMQLTQSGHDSDPQWSPDGLWIAFLSDRPAPGTEGKGHSTDDEKSPKSVTQVY